jgi:hypothetical protein
MMWEEGESCDHGIDGGCALVCEGCGHTCKRHPQGGECTHVEDEEQCDCETFERVPG